MGRSRDLGLDSGAGKGDKSRITNQSEYAKNFDAIDWGHKGPKPWVLPDGTRILNGSIDFAETEGEWPDVIGIGNHAPTTDIHRE